MLVFFFQFINVNEEAGSAVIGFVHLGSGYVTWTLEWVGKVLESMLRNGEPLEREVYPGAVLLSSGVPDYARENLYGNTSMGCFGMVFLLESDEGKPFFFFWCGIPYKSVCVLCCIKF